MEGAAPGPRGPDPQMMQDAEHIRLLAIFHYVWAALTALAASVPIIHVVIGFGILGGWKLGGGGVPGSGSSVPEAQIMGWFFVVFGGLIVLLGWGVALLTFLAGKYLSERRNRTFVFVMACISCASIPIGTTLGVFTIIVLQRPSVRELFESHSAGVGGSSRNS